jgi:excinuclease ABC subunit B
MAYDQILEIVVDLDAQMKAAAAELKFELAGRLRDEISELKYELRQIEKAGHA